MLWPKKNSYKESDNEKKKSCGQEPISSCCGLKIPLPTPAHITFLMVRPLLSSTVNRKSGQIRSQFLKAVQAFKNCYPKDACQCSCLELSELFDGHNKFSTQ